MRLGVLLPQHDDVLLQPEQVPVHRRLSRSDLRVQRMLDPESRSLRRLIALRPNAIRLVLTTE
jgi:hypothetical protein